MRIPPLWYVRFMIWLHVWCEDDGDSRHCRRCGRPSA